MLWDTQENWNAGKAHAVILYHLVYPMEAGQIKINNHVCIVCI